jgi:hypothetical protein
MMRRSMAAGLVLGAGLAMVPAPAHGGVFPGNFRPDARLDTSQAIDRTTPASGCSIETLDNGTLVVRCSAGAGSILAGMLS